MWLAKRIAPLPPPILILGLARSGTSWVGETLGSANNALYLREPLNQELLAAGAESSVQEVDPRHPPRAYGQAAARAFLGLPVFSETSGTVVNPEQWRLSERRRRRLVIKEVNPLACEWLLRYRPRVVFITRHPAAIALSWRKLGWWDSPAGSQEEARWCLYHGRYQATVLREALDSLTAYDDVRIVQYEVLCANPLDQFQRLFEFAGLEYSQHIRNLIRERTSSGDQRQVYGTARDSRMMIRAWAGKLTCRELVDLRNGYESIDLPWYRTDGDWQE